MIRVRLTYKKGASLKYTGHLDLHKVWERTFRRAQLPLAYSNGFHPQPRIQQACPLPLGFISDCEIIDLWLCDELSIESIHSRLIPALQPGIKITKIESVSPADPALQSTVIASEYQCLFLEDLEKQLIQSKIKTFLAEDSIIRERRGKPYDLRSLVQELTYHEDPDPCLIVRLTTMPGATGRPEELLDALGIDLYAVQVKRVGLVFTP